jgi:hypothetical protein
MTQEALKLAQIALDDIEHQRFSWRRFDALVAIKQALAQQERPWVGLTGQEKAWIASVSLDTHDAVYRADVKLKEKNT